MSTSLIGAFRQIRLNGDITTTTGDTRMMVAGNVHMIVSDSGALNTTIFNTGAAAIAYTNVISGILDAKIAANSAGVSTLNGLSGAVNLIGSGNIKLNINGQNIHIYDSGLANSGDLTTLSSTIASTGQQAWTAANNNGINLSGNVSTLTTNLGLTGQSLFQRDLDISGALQALITNADADVSSVNGQSGIIQITGVGLITVSSGSPGVINVSVDTSTLATNANLALTGSQAWNAANNNGINLSGNLTQTGVQLRVYSNFLASGLSGHANSIGSTLSGNMTQTGVQLGNTIASTGQQLYNLTTGLSGTLTGYVQISTERFVATEIPTGAESHFILWTPNFPSIPRYVQNSVEISTGDIYYFAGVTNRTISGYTAIISDIVLETGVFVHTHAKL